MFFFLAFQPLFAGDLDDFEEGMLEDKDIPEDDGESHWSQRDDQDRTDDGYDPDTEENGTANVFLALIMLPICPLIGAAESWNYTSQYKISGLDYLENIPKRKPGDKHVPYFQISETAQVVNKDIFALDSSIEAGFGFILFKYHHLQYFEKDPEDRLSFDVFAFLFRMSFFSKFEICIGTGPVYAAGNEFHNYILFTFPVRIFLPFSIMLEYTPEFYFYSGHYTVNNHEITLSYNIRYASFKAGCRFLFVSGRKLNGFVLGAVFRL